MYLQCTFADESTAGSAALVDRLWNFGDGTEGTAASGTHTFASAGTYRVRLTVRDADGLSDSHVLFVSVRPPNVPPVASFSAACTDLVCRFTNTSVDSDGTIVASAWTFGAFGTSSVVSPTFKFPATGTYPVTLAVTDQDGAVSSVTSTVDVRPLLHAAFVDTRITSSGSGMATFWRVAATVAVHGADERPVAGATMRVTWNGGPLPTAVTCVSGVDGLCTFDSGPMLRALREWATFTVLNLSAPLGTYQPGVNHDKDGTATGMSVTIFRP
jgi:PKD repeat protein